MTKNAFLAIEICISAFVTAKSAALAGASAAIVVIGAVIGAMSGLVAAVELAENESGVIKNV